VENVIDQSLIIWLLPLAAFILQIFFGKRLPRNGDWLPTVAIFASLILAINVFGTTIPTSSSPAATNGFKSVPSGSASAS
jgi:NADH-quinone oxidoreductase subunit L